MPFVTNSLLQTSQPQCLCISLRTPLAYKVESAYITLQTSSSRIVVGKLYSGLVALYELTCNVLFIRLMRALNLIRFTM